MRVYAACLLITLVYCMRYGAPAESKRDVVTVLVHGEYSKNGDYLGQVDGCMQIYTCNIAYTTFRLLSLSYIPQH